MGLNGGIPQGKVVYITGGSVRLARRHISRVTSYGQQAAASRAVWQRWGRLDITCGTIRPRKEGRLSSREASSPSTPVPMFPEYTAAKAGAVTREYTDEEVAASWRRVADNKAREGRRATRRKPLSPEVARGDSKV
ncbi:hypothetical protein PpBr36_08912 [Pyricularia pennisetigena]|uniref:hypothetical protein n=1 Tax=Pyricularia pennisetigena TaxID=1578925 RepID=UPI0011521054|nr:hypothetical protein PpBr36_08912 [Pyricularia pennisetigena]TLS24190.1 hypothetical protein PpBr36_08912 [Pyricularia pennisetigena]